MDGEPTLADYQAAQCRMVSHLIDLWNSPEMIEASARAGRAVAERFHASLTREMEAACSGRGGSPGRSDGVAERLMSWPKRRWSR